MLVYVWVGRRKRPPARSWRSGIEHFVYAGITHSKIFTCPSFKATLQLTRYGNFEVLSSVSQNSVGAYYCSILFEWTEKTPTAELPTMENTLGLDYSSPLFYVDDHGRSPDKPRFFRAYESKLAKEQRKLSKMQYGSKNYLAQKKRVDKIHEKIANQRRDFCHQESRKIANSYAAVCVEDINLRALSRSLRLGKSTMDNGFGMFRNFLKYKLEEQGKHYIVIDKWFPSSKTCNCCGYINKDLVVGVPEWICPECGLVVARDHNAALNIKQEGLRMFYAPPGAAA